LAALLVSGVACVSAQTSNSQLIPAVSFPTPEATAIDRYGTYKISYFTGLPEISIPLHEIKVGEITLPITLSYHPSGIKVTDRPSNVGLGWIVEAGGSVTRKVMGLVDDRFAGQGYLTNSTIPATVNTMTQTGLTFLQNVNTGQVDTEPDIYSYHVPGHNGQFIMNRQNGLKPLLIPYQPMKIEWGYATNLMFNLTDEKGVLYKLDSAYETTQTNGQSSVTRWLIHKIIGANKQDTIRISYSPWHGTTFTDITESITVKDSIDYAVGTAADYQPDDTMVPEPRTDVVDSDELNLKTIKFPYGKVVFESLTNRDDDSNIVKKKKLDRIIVYVKDPVTGVSSVTKSIEFIQSYFKSADGSTKRLRLDGLWIRDSNGVIIQRYKFEYDTLHNLPAYTSKSRDYWGYHNGKANSTLVPYNSVSFKTNAASQAIMKNLGGLPNGREPDTVYMQSNVLTKIYYPTGGNSQFTYQTNRYDKNGVKKFAGGLRIYQIKSYDGIQSTATVKTYKYGVNQSGYGRANFWLENLFYRRTYGRSYWKQVGQALACPYVATICRVRTYVSNPTVDLEPFDSSPVTYSEVTEYIGNETQNTGKTVYTFQDTPDQLNTFGPTGLYFVQSNHFRRGLLLNKSVYKRTGSTYQIVSRSINTYQAFPDTVVSRAGYKAFKLALADDTNNTDRQLGPYDAAGACSAAYNDSYSFLYGSYDYKSGDNKLVSTKEITYDQGDITRTDTISTSYLYENRFHQQVTKKTTSNSRRQVKDVSTKYPFEVSSPVYTEMIQKHLYAYPVEELVKLNGTDLQWTGWHFKKYSTYVFKPDTIYQRLESGPKEAFVSFQNYDIHGNPLGYIDQEGIPVSFVYGYRNLYPIAKITGAATGQVAFTSFESEGNEGGWTFGGSASGAKYGTKVHALSTPVTKSGLATNIPYVISYWAKGGTPTLAATIIATNDAPAAGPDGWRYFEKTIMGSASVSISGTGATLIDEVRLFPKGASMITYTYIPHIGISSKTDSEGLTSYFTYDSFARLAFIKDSQGKILKNFVYNYKK